MFLLNSMCEIEKKQKVKMKLNEAFKMSLTDTSPTLCFPELFPKLKVDYQRLLILPNLYDSWENHEKKKCLFFWPKFS